MDFFDTFSSVVAIVVMIAVAVVTVFARRWRLGVAVLGGGMLIVAAPLIFIGLRTGEPVVAIGDRVLAVWVSLFPLISLSFLVAALLAIVARRVWDDLGQGFKVIVDRWGVRGAVVFIVFILAAYAVFLTIPQH